MTAQPSVLVVDDDADNCRNLADILADMGYHVDTAHDGPAGLAMIRARPYDVAVLDYKMPGMTGVEVYQKIRESSAGTVGVIVSAYTDQSTRQSALGKGVWQVLSKPVDVPKLLALVDEAVAQPLVLVVDDDPDLGASLWDILRDRGYRVCLAGDARTAIDRFKERQYKVVLVTASRRRRHGGSARGSRGCPHRPRRRDHGAARIGAACANEPP